MLYLGIFKKEENINITYFITLNELIDKEFYPYINKNGFSIS